MKLKFPARSLLALSLAATPALAQSTRPTTMPAAPALGVGDPAPALKVGGWFKGTPVTAFSPGHVYVVEFWATWCGPCKRSIPHLTELAHKYRADVTFVGVDIWERPSERTDATIAALVRPFVDRMGSKMDYTVAADGADGFMSDRWMKAALQDAIPEAFIVGRDGKLAWIGYPTAMEPVLDAVVANTWDVAAEVRRVGAERVATAGKRALFAQVMTARQAKDYPGVTAAVDRTVAAYPSEAENVDLPSVRIDALAHYDVPGLLAYVRQLTRPGGLVDRRPNLVWSIVRAVPVDPANHDLSPGTYGAIVDACRPMVGPAQQGEPAICAVYADLLARAGRTTEAVPYMRRAVDDDAEFAAAHPEDANLPHNVAYRKGHQDRLAALTKAAGSGA